MAETQRSPGRNRAAAASDLRQEIVANTRAADGNGQAITLPSLADARARLFEVIRRRPAPKPVYATGQDLRPVGTPRPPARRAADPAPDPGEYARCDGNQRDARSVARWRAGERNPTVRHWRQLRALHGLLAEARS